MHPVANQCLIVDDSEIIRKIARLIMEQLHYTVTEAESGEEALGICANQMPGIILLDSVMPGLSTQDFLTSLAEQNAQANPKVLYCISEFDRNDMALAYAAGITDYILKPFDIQSLSAKIQSLTADAA